MGDIITYEALYEILRKEKYEKELQKLDPIFFQSVIKYLDEKEVILASQKSKDSVFAKESDKTQKQLENIRKILREIYEKREGKIVMHALISSRFNENNLLNMLSEEAQFYNDIKNILNKYRINILENLLLKKLPNLVQEEIKQLSSNIKEVTKTNNAPILLRILEPVPQFIGDDLIIYGPFENEDVISLPFNMATILINKNKAEEMKPELTS